MHVCAEPGCPRLTDTTRCPDHTRDRQQHRDQQRGRTAARGYDAAWQRRSRDAITSQLWCSVCGATADLTTDHVLPLKHGGTTDGPVQVLCRRCNSRKRDRG